MVKDLAQHLGDAWTAFEQEEYDLFVNAMQDINRKILKLMLAAAYLGIGKAARQHRGEE